MAKYCKLAGRVTNCTDNCRICLEEEAKTREIKVGDKVRYITEDPEDVKETGYYPPKGTIGTIIGIDSIFFCRSVPHQMAGRNDQVERVLVCRKKRYRSGLTARFDKKD